jgi:phospholipase A2
MPAASVYGWLLDSSKIHIANASTSAIHIALYYTRNTSGERIGKPILIPPNKSITIDLPSPKLLHSRLMLAAQSRKELSKKKLVNMQQAALLGIFYASDYIVTINQATGRCEIIEKSQWNKMAKPTDFIPYHLTTTCPEKQQMFLAARTAHTHNLQQEYCQHPLTKPLKIGICASGGGFRALLATAGVLAGLEQIQVLPLVQTCIGLSGATWFLFPWVLSNTSATDFAKTMTGWLGQGLLHHLTAQYKDLASVLAIKKQHNLPTSAIDFYSINLAYTLLKPLSANALSLTMDDIATAINPASHPLIVGSMVTRPRPTSPYEWILTSPYCMHFINSGICLPPGLMGAYFYNGNQVTRPPAPLLSYHLAIFGSAPSASIRDALERSPDSLQKIINKIMPTGWHEATWSNTKLTAAHIANPHYALKGSPIKTIPQLALVDGGYLNNLPLEPTIATAKEPYDIIICIDANQHRSARIARIKAAHEAASKQAPDTLAPFDFEAIATQPFSRHHDKKAQTTILYFTVEGSDDYDPIFNPAADPSYATIRLVYPKQRAERLVAYMQYVVAANQKIIQQTIIECAQQKFGLDETVEFLNNGT